MTTLDVDGGYGEFRDCADVGDRLVEICADFRTELCELMVLLDQHPEESVRLLASRLDFNEIYQKLA